MSEPVTAAVPHRLGKEEALRRLKAGLGRAKGHLGGLLTIERETWSGDTLDFQMRLSNIKEEVTVTATGSEQSTFEAFQSVNTVDALTLSRESHPSIGEVLDKEPGVAKRSFGPGSARPVVRGFDGDRVMITQDGASTGSLGSQSADHAEPIDVLSLERIEVVKGPATLLYGSSAVGGVVSQAAGDCSDAWSVRDHRTHAPQAEASQGGVERPGRPQA